MNTPENAALVGPWPAMPDGVDRLSLGGITIVRCPESRSRFTRFLAGRKPGWLVVSSDMDDRAIRDLLYCGHAVLPNLRVAVLVKQSDTASHDRWLRRGVAAVAPMSAPAHRLATLLRASDTTSVVVIDRSLTGRAAQQPVVSLTVREEQVLWLIRQGLTNEEIGDELRLTRSTIQFHVSNILTKLAARNRVEIVARAEQLGL
jgi:DNA-binding NarL/FixJ family response regulator